MQVWEKGWFRFPSFWCRFVRSHWTWRYRCAPGASRELSSPPQVSFLGSLPRVKSCLAPLFFSSSSLTPGRLVVAKSLRFRSAFPLLGYSATPSVLVWSSAPFSFPTKASPSSQCTQSSWSLTASSPLFFQTPTRPPSVTYVLSLSPRCLFSSTFSPLDVRGHSRTREHCFFAQ